jgi:hypothetical protein
MSVATDLANLYGTTEDIAAEMVRDMLDEESMWNKYPGDLWRNLYHQQWLLDYGHAAAAARAAAIWFDMVEATCH